jgi:hypothetical protein
MVAAGDGYADRDTIVALGVVLLAALIGIVMLGFFLTRRSKRRPAVPHDLRRADDAQGQPDFDVGLATEEAEAMYWRNRPLP